MERRKVAAVYSDFISDLDALLRLDSQNQRRYQVGPGRPAITRLTTKQMILLTESLFNKAFSNYEMMMEDLFILYAKRKPSVSGVQYGSYILPKDNLHAREIIKSNMQFLDWNSPSNIIQRCETYLGDPHPIKLALTTHSSKLLSIKKVRNAIAHRSIEATMSFNNVVRTELRAAPLKQISPGEFLLSARPKKS